MPVFREDLVRQPLPNQGKFFISPCGRGLPTMWRMWRKSDFLGVVPTNHCHSSAITQKGESYSVKNAGSLKVFFFFYKSPKVFSQYKRHLISWVSCLTTTCQPITVSRHQSHKREHDISKCFHEMKL